MAIAGVANVSGMIRNREDGSLIKERNFELISLEPGPGNPCT